MERVAFLVEMSGQRIDCLLNPESVVVRREAGVRQRTLQGVSVSGINVSDSPLVHTGGGRTELNLDLLFDVSLAGAEHPVVDVRELTKPLWDLSENDTSINNTVPYVWFVWGKFWRIFGVVSSVAERLEYFTAEGIPRRSWLRLQMLRAPEPTVDSVNEREQTPLPLSLGPEEFDLQLSDEDLQSYQFVGVGGENTSSLDGESDSTVRIDLAAFELTGHAELWRWLIPKKTQNPFDIAAGESNLVSPRSAISDEI